MAEAKITHVDSLGNKWELCVDGVWRIIQSNGSKEG